MFLRVKRTNQTIFLSVDPSESLSDVKKKLSAITKQPIDNLRLLGTDQHPLSEDKTVADNKLENDQVIYWVQKKEGNFDDFFVFCLRFKGSDAWEEVNTQKIEPPKGDQTEDKS